jgi:hypothetical protein
LNLQSKEMLEFLGMLSYSEGGDIRRQLRRAVETPKG